MQLGLIFTQTSKFMYESLERQKERKEIVLKKEKEMYYSKVAIIARKAKIAK